MHHVPVQRTSFAIDPKCEHDLIDMNAEEVWDFIFEEEGRTTKEGGTPLKNVARVMEGDSPATPVKKKKRACMFDLVTSCCNKVCVEDEAAAPTPTPQPIQIQGAKWCNHPDVFLYS